MSFNEQLRVFAPELLGQLERRYDVLKSVYYLQPVGRRALAAAINLTEREVRSETDSLRKDGLIDITAAGMHTTVAGAKAVEELYGFIMQLRNIKPLEEALGERLSLTAAAVPGNIGTQSVTADELASRACRLLWQSVKAGEAVAVYEGRLTLAMGRNVKGLGSKAGVIFMPAVAWQTIGGHMSYEAAYALARAFRGKRLRPKLPETLSAADLENVSSDTQVRPYINTLSKLKAAVFDINVPETVLKSYPYRLADTIRGRGAAAECMGIFYNADGKLVYAGGRIGLTPEALPQVPLLIGLAAGKDTAAAVKAAATALPHLTLVTDQALAQAVLNAK